MSTEPLVTFDGQRSRPLRVTQTGVVWKLAGVAEADDEIRRGRGPCSAEPKDLWSRTIVQKPFGESRRMNQTYLLTQPLSFQFRTVTIALGSGLLPA